MKTLLLSLMLLVAATFSASAQSLTIKNGDTTLTYNGYHYKKGDTVQLNYGSGSDKSFEFISTANFPAMMKDINVMPRTEKLKADDSKLKFVITQVYISTVGKPCFSGRADWAKDYTGEGTMDLTITVDLVGAIDNKEIVLPKKLVDNPVKRPRKVHQ